MSNIKNELDQIELPEELHSRSKKGIYKAKADGAVSTPNSRKFISIAISLLIVVGVGFVLLNLNSGNQKANGIQQNDDGSIDIPAIELPDNPSSADMIGLIVYQGNVYTQTRTEINYEDAQDLIDEQIGVTKGNIDEWSDDEAYTEELASSIGSGLDVYTMKGYDEGFRIMAFDWPEQGRVEIFERLNGITIQNSQDLFEKLKLQGHVKEAEYRTFDDWNYNRDNYHAIEDTERVQSFVDGLYNMDMKVSGDEANPIRESRNNDEFRELIFHLDDGTKVRLTLIKGGYIHYSYTGIYFEMKQETFQGIWKEMIEE
ncbi:hypothetical protein [Aquisalibacillus elongatus]|uniref:Uncharacterized protein n=1 Tax=Aquisalibacillus elongatus TaxID=485577 RepID=A0A3N5B413_9BACI|nr:hypothetical protein [Aquisalibacillus elongatus]RPF52053.1 hypothetical protein EDC24_2043 [Aquisalibacillus elongatus]